MSGVTVRYAQEIPDAIKGEDGAPGQDAISVNTKVTTIVSSELMATVRDFIAAGASTITLDLNRARIFRITANGNFTIAVVGGDNGAKFSVAVTQDATGSRLVTWFAGIKWAGGVAPTLTTTLNKRDTLGFEKWLTAGVISYDGFVIGKNI